MASNANNKIPSAASPNDSPSPTQQNALITSETRQQHTTSSAISASIFRPAMAPAQPQATKYNLPNTRGSRELRFMIALRYERVKDLNTNQFADQVINELQQAFEAQCQVDTAGAVTTDEGKLLRRKIECVKAGLYALRSIHTAWLKYPAVGGRLEGAPIGVVDFMYTARSAAVEKPPGQLAAQYARIMADAVDPPQDDIESAPHAQLRVNKCFSAIKKQFMALFPLLDPKNLSDYLFDDDILSEDEAAPKTYRLPTTVTLHPPSTAAQLMSASGLAAAAEDEDDDNQHVFVTGGVLKTKAEKCTDLAVQVAKAKKDELAEAARTRVRASASKATAPTQSKSNASNSDLSPVGSDEDEEGDEEDDKAVGGPTKKPAARKAAANNIKGGRKRIDDYEEGSNADTNQQPAKQPKLILRKRSARDAGADDAEEDDDAPKPAPKKRAKSIPASKTASDKSSENSPSSGTSGEAGSVAPNIVKRGGAAPKWLKDEDDMVKQMIVDHPDWPMPKVYREYSTWVANTSYQRHGQVLVEYRADFVEFPKGVIVSDKERRRFDIAWRTYESVRQHTEKFKANVSNADTSPPYTWDPAQNNLVAGQPKRAPPPRPAFFNNVARTPVPLVAGQAAPAIAASSALRSSLAGTSAPPTASVVTRRSSGWNAVNYSAEPVVDDTPEQAGDEAASPAEEDDKGDARVDSIEDFVAQQSASSSSAGEAEDGKGDLSE